MLGREILCCKARQIVVEIANKRHPRACSTLMIKVKSRIAILFLSDDFLDEALDERYEFDHYREYRPFNVRMNIHTIIMRTMKRVVPASDFVEVASTSAGERGTGTTKNIGSNNRTGEGRNRQTSQVQRI